MRSYFLVLLFMRITLFGISQTYTSYFTGSDTDAETTAAGGICLMGGATEDDNAMTWFLERANGGDVLVLRASGGDGYNDYMFDLVTVNSVETIVFHDAAASADPYVLERIEQAEAIWLAGGDQWDYVSYWRNTAVDSLINSGIAERGLVIGGTSAGMAIQGGFYFSAENGTVTSDEALSDPYNENVTVDSARFIVNPYLADVITDTHYDDPDRKGRHTAFLARILTDYGVEAKGIACDEYTAVCIDESGLATIYGGYPDYDDNAYFLQVNCELTERNPEMCTEGNPLTWNLEEEAVKVYAVKGRADGSATFDLNDWKTGSGGEWQNWSVDGGELMEESGTEPVCPMASMTEGNEKADFALYPNPADDFITIHTANYLEDLQIEIFDLTGRRINTYLIQKEVQFTLDTKSFTTGLYHIVLRSKEGTITALKFQKN